LQGRTGPDVTKTEKVRTTLGGGTKSLENPHGSEEKEVQLNFWGNGFKCQQGSQSDENRGWFIQKNQGQKERVTFKKRNNNPGGNG